MIVGISINKMTRSNNQEVVAIVASMNSQDQRCTKYYSKCLIQNRSVLIEQLQAGITGMHIAMTQLNQKI